MVRLSAVDLLKVLALHLVPVAGGLWVLNSDLFLALKLLASARLNSTSWPILQ